MRRYAQIVVCLLVALWSFAQHKEDNRLEQSYTVLKEILDTPDKGIPTDLLNKANCVVVYPSVKKAAFIVGGSYGRGVITCRTGKDFQGPWSAPAMFALEGGSVGLHNRQINRILLHTQRKNTLLRALSVAHLPIIVNGLIAAALLYM